MPWLLLSMMLFSPASQDLLGRINDVITHGPAGQWSPSQARPEVSVFVERLDDHKQLAIEADKTFHAASTMKVPVMIELFRQAGAGLLKLDEQLPVKNEFHSIVDGSVYQMDVSDDSDAEVYKAAGKTMALRDLCEAMITVSSNFAANLLIERVGAKNVQATVERLGGTGVRVLRGVEDQKAFDKGLNNVTTARGLGVLFTHLASGTAVSPKADAEMIAILKRQKFNEGIPAGVPAGTAVAHKTGTITRIHHDAGIVFGPRAYVAVVLVRGVDDHKESGSLIAAVSRLVWDALAR